MRNDFDSVVADRFKLIDEVAVPDTWSRVRSKGLDHTAIQFSEEEMNMIDLEIPSPTEEHRKGPKRVVLAALLAAAAVIAIALVAIRNDEPVSPADQPPPTVVVPTTLAPRALFGTESEQFAPGTYYVDSVGGSPTPRIFVTLDDDTWSNGGDGALIEKDDLGVLTFRTPNRVAALDACHSDEGFHPGPMNTFDGVVTALTEQRGWLDVTVSDISVNGYVGKAIQRTVPTDLSGCTSVDDDLFKSFMVGGADGGGWSYYEPGEVETLWILDLDGTTIVINTRLKPPHQASENPQLAAVLDTIRIEQA